MITAAVVLFIVGWAVLSAWAFDLPAIVRGEPSPLEIMLDPRFRFNARAAKLAAQIPTYTNVSRNCDGQPVATGTADKA